MRSGTLCFGGKPLGNCRRAAHAFQRARSVHKEKVFPAGETTFSRANGRETAPCERDLCFGGKPLETERGRKVFSVCACKRQPPVGNKDREQKALRGKSLALFRNKLREKCTREPLSTLQKARVRKAECHPAQTIRKSAFRKAPANRSGSFGKTDGWREFGHCSGCGSAGSAVCAGTRVKWRLTGGDDPLGEREILNQGAVSERNAPNRAQFPAKYVETLCNAKESCALRAASMLREAAFF